MPLVPTTKLFCEYMQTWTGGSVSDCTVNSSGLKDKRRRPLNEAPSPDGALELLALVIGAEGDTSMHLFLRIKGFWTSHTIFLNLLKLSSLLSHGRHKRLGSPSSDGRVPALTISATRRRFSFFFRKRFFPYLLSKTLPQRRHLLCDSKPNFG